MAKMFLYLFIGGGLGCVSRFIIGRLCLRLYEGSFPLGTFLANVVSCLLAAVLIYFYSVKAGGGNKGLYLLLITGYCGGLSTFSTFSLETFELLKQGLYHHAILNIVLSIALSIGVFYFLYTRSVSS